MSRVFPHLLESLFPHMGEKKNPHFSETEIPHLVEKEFPHPMEIGIPHFRFSVIQMNRIWLLALLPFMDSIGFAVQVENPGMVQ